MRARTYIEDPYDVCKALSLLLYYVQVQEIDRPTPMYGKALRRACRILKIMSELRDGQRHWILPKEYRARLKLAGLDPKNPKRIVSQRRWDNAWQQLLKTETFKDDIAQRDIATGRKSARAQPHLKAVALRPKRERRVETVFKMPKLK